MADFAITKAEVIELAIAPELANVAKLTDTMWATTINGVLARVGLTGFGGELTTAKRAAALLAAHEMTLVAKRFDTGSSSPAQLGPLSSITVGPITKTYRNSGSIDSMSASGQALQTTSYGQEYYRMLQRLGPRAAVT